MKKFLEKIKRKFVLVVSLPENNLFLARAAEEGGADALKIHLNLWHRASGMKFGSFKEEKKNIEKILKEVKIPVGVVPGSQKLCSEDEIRELEKMGIDFLDIYIKDAPVYILENNLTKIFALSSDFELEETKILKKSGYADIFEASIVKPEKYGERLNLFDLIRYRQIVEFTKMPVLVPTQKKILPSEVKFLKEISVSGIMIGAIVFGKEKEEIKRITSLFRKAIDF